jgi:hypothetical protein
VFGFIGTWWLSVNDFDNGHLKPLFDQPQYTATREAPTQTLPRKGLDMVHLI